MRLSVIVCTWNRSRLLRRTLEEMERLVIPDGVDWELVLVDNASTDDTPEMVREFQDALPLRYLVEERQGHSHARNAGVAAARGELLLFTDDDVLVDPHWLAEHAGAARRYPEALVFGGTVAPWFEREPPGWVRRNLERMQGVYAIRQLGEEVRLLAEDEFVFGANLGFRAHVFREARFDTRLGRRGGEMLSGEETALVRRIQRRRPNSVLWVGTARVRHFIPADRLTTRYVWRFYRGLGRTRARMGGPARGRRIAGVPLWILRQYASFRLKSLLYAPLKDRRWLEAFREAAMHRGLMDEFARANASPQEPAAGR